LRARAQDDRPRLEQVLRSHGYYAAQVAVDIDRESDPALVTFTIDPGPLYRLEDIAIESEPADARVALPMPQDLGLEPGQAADAERILQAEIDLLAAVREEGHPLATAGDRRAVVDHDRRVMDLTLRVVPGPKARFGAVEIRGLEEVDADFVRRRLPWQEGELITTERLDEGRRALRETGLFNSIAFEMQGSPDSESEQLPVEVVLIEREHRSITVGWIHRNFFGRGERIELEADASGIGAFLQGSVRKPDVWRRNLAVVGQSRVAYEDTEAFESRSASAGAGLEYTFAERKTLTGGIAYKAEEIDDKSDDDNDGAFGLVSLPVRLDWDMSDDRLDPSEGGRLRLYNEPFVDTLGEDLQFNKSRLDYAHYFEVYEQPQIVLAGRAAVGTLFGASRADIPATERFYAGGGGSVRGWGFQLAGPLDEDDNPLGGRSLLELSGEVRVRITDTIGVAAFVDAGTTYDSNVPNFDEPLRVGVGPGVRYFSPIGPLRADLGIPLKRRDSDDAFQFYVSFGQAF
jgi:translocation and assembly module TamA